MSENKQKVDRNAKEKAFTLSKKGLLNEVQKKVAEEIAYKGLTGKTEEEIAKEYNVSKVTIWRWKAIPAFNEETNRIVREYQKSHLVDVNKILLQILTRGTEKSQLKAIELYYRNQGLFKDTLEVTETKEKTVNVEDLMEELRGM